MNNKIFFPILLAALLFPAVSLAAPANDKFLKPGSGVKIILPGDPLTKPAHPDLKSVFYTKELESFVEFSSKMKRLGQNKSLIPDKDKVRLQDERKLSAAEALASLQSTYALENEKIEKKYSLDKKVIRNQSEESLASGNREIDIWYEKNKGKPGAKEKAARMRVQLAKMVAEHEEAALADLFKSTLRSLNNLELEYKQFQGATRLLNQETKAIIESLKTKPVVVIRPI